MRTRLDNMNDGLLVKYMLGEADDAEQQQVTEWLQHSADNRKQFDDFKLIWKQGKELSANTTVDEHAAWARFRQRVAAPKESGTPNTIAIPRNNSNWMKVAASIVLLLGLSWMAYFFGWIGGNADMLALQSANGVLIDTLSDGTIVTLNKNSELQYPEAFKGGNREVVLKGEAFFNVAPDKAKPFIITTGEGVSIKVVGTSFNVKNDSGTTEVIVETGIVEVAKSSSKVELYPDEKATVAHNAAPVKETNEDNLYTYYRTQEFVCDHTPLWQLVAALEKAYEVKINVAESKKDLLLSVTLKAESLDNILSIVSETLSLSVKKKDGVITLM